MSNANLPTISIKGSEYVLVKDRILYFNDTYPNGSIVPQLLTDFDADMIVMRAKVTPDVSVPDRYFIAYSQAKWNDGFINKTSALENCETSAVGRALGFMGIGVIDSIASVDEINKAQTQPAYKRPIALPGQEQVSPIKLAEVGTALAEKGVDDEEDRKKIFKAMTNGERLNTSGYNQLMKRIDILTLEELYNLIAVTNEG